MTTSDFTVSSDNIAGWTVVSAVGELDMATAPRLRGAIRTASEDDASLVLDLSQVSFMDSSALRVLVETHRSVAALGGEMRLVVATTRVQKILDLSGLTRVFAVYSSAEEATSSPKTSL